jgi:hypothetical protein
MLEVIWGFIRMAYDILKSGNTPVLTFLTDKELVKLMEKIEKEIQRRNIANLVLEPIEKVDENK